MPAQGQKATLQGDRHMSAQPSEADIAEALEHARKGSKADICSAEGRVRFYAQKQTFVPRLNMSAKGHKQTFRHIPPYLD
jgi:hypothetical protein